MNRKMQVTGAYSRMAPRYPVSMFCEIVHVTESRWRSKKTETLVTADIAELSVTGMGLMVHSETDTDRYRVGMPITFRLGGYDGRLDVRHLHANHQGLRIGGEFSQLHPELEKTIHRIISEIRTD